MIDIVFDNTIQFLSIQNNRFVLHLNLKFKIHECVAYVNFNIIFVICNKNIA